MSEFLFNVPWSFLRRLLEYEQASEAPYSDEGVRASYLIDYDRGKVKSQRAYARIWRWSHKRVRVEWEAITSDCENYRTGYGKWGTHTSHKGTARAQSGHSPGTKNGHPVEQEQIEGTARAQSGHSPGTQLIQTSSKEDKTLSPSPARTREEAPQDQVAYPSEDPTMNNPFVVAFRDTFGRWPPLRWREKITSAVTDSEAWLDTLTLWKASRYNENNIHGLLSNYESNHEARTDPGYPGRTGVDGDVRSNGGLPDRTPRGINGSFRRGTPGGNPYSRGRVKRDGELGPREYLERCGYSDAEISRLLGEDASGWGFGPTGLLGTGGRDT